jgi:hypothetical protein
MMICLCSCGEKLSELRTIELIRLNYKQLSTTKYAGTWLIDSIIVDKTIRLEDDSLLAYKVTARITGIYQVPVIEDAPSGYSERFLDTLQFVARKFNNVWMADDWTIIGSHHE